jgi:hypothetical protein
LDGQIQGVVDLRLGRASSLGWDMLERRAGRAWEICALLHTVHQHLGQGVEVKAAATTISIRGRVRDQDYLIRKWLGDRNIESGAHKSL